MIFVLKKIKLDFLHSGKTGNWSSETIVSGVICYCSLLLWRVVFSIPFTLIKSDLLFIYMSFVCSLLWAMFLIVLQLVLVRRVAYVNNSTCSVFMEMCNKCKQIVCYVFCNIICPFYCSFQREIFICHDIYVEYRK